MTLLDFLTSKWTSELLSQRLRDLSFYNRVAGLPTPAGIKGMGGTNSQPRTDMAGLELTEKCSTLNLKLPLFTHTHTTKWVNSICISSKTQREKLHSGVKRTILRGVISSKPYREKTTFWS